MYVYCQIMSKFKLPRRYSYSHFLKVFFGGGILGFRFPRICLPSVLEVIEGQTILLDLKMYLLVFTTLPEHCKSVVQ